MAVLAAAALVIAQLVTSGASEGTTDEPTDTTEVEEQALPAFSYAVMQRVACIEQKESRGLNVANYRGSGAVGVMQYMPRTFYAHAAEMGYPAWSPWVPWQARLVAAHDLVLGRRSQWTVSGCAP